MSFPLYGLPMVSISISSLNVDSSLPSLADRRQHFELKILSLKALWNAEVPINRLPPELLIEIMQYFLDPVVPKKQKNVQPTGLTTNLEQWMPLMRVCRHWRGVACGYPRLWSTIRISSAASLRWFTLAASRSAKAPLTLVFRWIPPPTDDFTRLLLEHVASIQHLRFAVVLSDWAIPTFSALIRAGMPSLHELTVDVPIPPPLPGSVASSTWVRISEDVTPHLSHLTLRHAYISWTPGLLANMRRLHLTKCVYEPSPPTWGDFLDALRHAVHLEDLKLDDFLPSATGDVRPMPVERTELPSLRRLQLVDKPTAICLFLSHFRLPSGAHLSLTGQYERVNMDVPDPSVAFTSLLPRTTPDLLSTTHHVYLSTATRRPTVMCRGRDKSNLDLNLVCPTVTSWNSWTNRALENLSILLHGVPVLSLHIQRGYDAPETPQETWEHLLDSLPTLEAILVAGGRTSVVNLFYALGAGAVHADGPGGGGGGASGGGRVEQTRSLRCPQLRAVSVQDGVPYRDGLVEAVAGCLEWRGARGARKLEELRFGLAHRRGDDYDAALKLGSERLAGLVDMFEYESST